MLPQVWGGSSASSYYRAASHFLWLSQAAFYQPIDRPGQAGERAASQCQLPARTSVSPKVYQPLIWPRSPPPVHYFSLPNNARLPCGKQISKARSRKSKAKNTCDSPQKAVKRQKNCDCAATRRTKSKMKQGRRRGRSRERGGVGREAAGMSASRRRR